MMKKFKRIVWGLILGVVFQAVAGMAVLPPVDVTVVQAAGNKSGMVKSGKQYFYYKNGKKVKNKWKTIKGFCYYFGKKGAAVSGLTKIKDKLYYFDEKGRMKRNYWYKKTYYFDNKGRSLTGVQCIKKNYVFQLYYFDSNGKLIKEKQKILNAYNNDSMYGKPVDSLEAVIGKPLSIEYPEEEGCFGTGRDVILHYPGFQVLCNEDKGIIYFQGFGR